MKVWNLEDTSYPLSTSKKGIVVNGVWMHFWPSAALTYDNALNYNSFGSYLLPVRDYDFRQYLLVNPGSSMFSISANDAVNGLAEGTLAGCIYTMFAPPLLYVKELDNAFTKSRFLCSTVSVVDSEPPLPPVEVVTVEV